MRKTCLLLVAILTLSVSLTFSSYAHAAPYSFYQLNEITPAPDWDGTDADRLRAPTGSYDYTYGDDESLTYALPWPLVFYGQTYNHITVDTNGNIWFGSDGSAYSFTLADTSKSPVIASWNNDLTSRHHGGVFVQRKANPDRVVVEWQTETFTDEAYHHVSNFEVVIFPSADIRIDYKTFHPSAGKDFGSGISKSNNINSLNLTTTYGNAFTMDGRYFAFTAIPPTLTVTFSGTGSGIVTSTPIGLACSTGCSATFPVGTEVTLQSAASQFSLFTGWAGESCSGTGDCVTTLLDDTSINAAYNIDTAHQVRIDGTSPSHYTTIQGAYDVAPDVSVIKLWALTYNESLLCNRPIEMTLKGGYNESYTTVIDEAILNGAITISDGTVIVDGLSVR